MELISQLIEGHELMLSALILIIAYVFIATEKIPKVTVALIGAALTMFLGIVSQDKGIETINPHYFINFIDFNVIFLLVSMMIIVHIASKSGLFNWVANELLKLTKGKPIMVLLALAAFTAVASAFLDNVTTVILILPITFVVAEKLDINPVPMLITEIISSNIGGTSTLIGDPPNIIIGSKAGFSFMTFINELTLIVVLIFAVVFAFLWLCFRNHLKTTEEKMSAISQIDNSQTIVNKLLAWRSGIVLLLVILGFVTHDITHFQTYLVAMAGASFLLIFEKPDSVFEDVEWNTIFFFIGLFIIIGGLEATGGIKLMAQWVLDVTNDSQSAASMLILWVSGILSGIIDNIPYTATMTPLIYQIQLVEGAQYAHPLWWCLSLGACLGGNMTIIGAAANVIVSEMSAARGHKISFMYYLKYGVAVTVISLLMSTGYIWIKYLR